MELKSIRLDAGALRLAMASQLLALDPEAIGGSFVPRIASAPDWTGVSQSEQTDTGIVAVVALDGPLAQNAIEGWIDGYDALAERVCGALANPAVSAVVLRVNSPGGDLAGLEESIARMGRARVASGKPVLAYVDELAASAAYWIASCVATGGVYLPAAGQVGSIGVIGCLVDETKALEQAGIGVTLVRDPPGKAEGHPAGPIADLASQRLQIMVAESSGRFARAVGAARGVPEQYVRDLNGACLTGQRAVDGGLANGIASFEGVVAMAAIAAEENDMHSVAKAMGLEGASPAVVLRGIANLQRAAGLRAEDPPPPPADDEKEPPPSEKEPAEAMRATCPQCGCQFALDYQDEEKAAASLARSVRRVTGQRDPSAALGTVEAWRDVAAQARLDRAERQQQALVAERAERDELVQGLVARGEHPCTAWADPAVAEDRSRRVPAEPWASMPIARLRARVAGLLSVYSPSRPAPASHDASEAEAKAAGVSLDSYRKARAAMARSGG